MTTINTNYIKYVLSYFVLVSLGMIFIWTFVHVMAVVSFFIPVLILSVYVISPDLATNILRFFKIIKESQSINLKKIFRISAGFVVFGVLCTGIVFLEAKLLCNFSLSEFNPNEVHVEIPEHGQYMVGQIFPFKIDIGASKVGVNAVQSDLGFDPSILKVVDIKNSDSFNPVYLEKTINNEAGFIRISGGIPNPGVKDGGNFATISFIALKKGPAKIQFLPSSLILQNDGYGTNILKKYPVATYYFADTANLNQKEIENLSAELVDFSIDPNAINDDGQIGQIVSNNDRVLGAYDFNNSSITTSYANPNKFMSILRTVDIWILGLCFYLFI